MVDDNTKEDEFEDCYDEVQHMAGQGASPEEQGGNVEKKKGSNCVNLEKAKQTQHVDFNQVLHAVTKEEFKGHIIKDDKDDNLEVNKDLHTTRTWKSCGRCNKYNHFPNKKFCRWALKRKHEKKQKKISSDEMILNNEEIFLIKKHVAFLDQVKSSKTSTVSQLCREFYKTQDNYWPYRISEVF